MEGASRFRILCLHLICVFSNILAFNLDTKVPIVKEGVDGAYFGFSLAQHPIYQYATSQTEHVLLVGAPRDNITEIDVNPKIRNLVRPGNVYSCPLTSETDDCTPINVFRSDPLSEEDRNDQWLGVAVASQGTQEGKAVVCAHRYKLRGLSYNWGQGICMSMTNALDEDAPYEPCSGKETGHNYYGFCQAGASVDVSAAGDILIGSPGSVNWRGTVDKNIVRESLDEVNEWFTSPAENPIEGVEGPNATTGYYSYLGMATKICKIIDGQPTYIGGAPRAKNVGQVIMFLQGADHLTTQKKYYLSGEQFGSYFGYDMAVIDINGDGREDLAVGAPFFHGTRIGGAVYIYMNSPRGITDQTDPIKLLGYKEKQAECNDLDCTNSRFGFSVVNGGDLDLDGYEDLVVGAPYEGLGAVYIFRGSETGIIPEPSQRIYASDLQTARPMAGFGYSLAGGMDMDQNGYPDVAVGAYNVDKAMIIRTRPVVNMDVYISSTPVKIDPRVKVCDKDNRQNNCFKLQVCFQFMAKPKDRFTEKLEIDYTLEAEKFAGRQLSRVFFKGAEDDAGHVITRSIRINEQTNPEHKCRDHRVYIIKNNRDFLNPLQFRVTMRLKDRLPPTMNPGEPIPDINLYPILNSISSTATQAVDFIKNCGEDSRCHSNLGVTAKFLLDRDTVGDYVLKAGVDVEPKLEITVKNDGEDAHETSLTIVLPPSVSYRGVIKDGRKEYSCVPLEDTVFCNVDNPLMKGDVAQFTIKFNAINIEPSTDKVDFQLRVNTTSTEVDDQDDTFFLRVRVVVETDMLVKGSSDPTDVFYSGKVVGESAIRYEEEIGEPIKHTYEIENSGQGTVARSEVHVSWPYEVNIGYPKGKHLLYLIRYEADGDTTVTCDIDPSRLNPLNIRPGFRPGLETTNTTEKSRLKRDTPETAASYEYDSGAGGGQVVLKCDKGAKCFTFVCDIGVLKSQKSVVIKLYARLWSSTFLEEYRTVSSVKIYSKAQLVLDPVLNIRQNTTANDMFEVMTRALPEIDITDKPSVPLWVIIVATIAGIILLVIIILLLWKCGFFKRTKHDDMQKHKVKVDKKKKNYQDYD